MNVRIAMRTEAWGMAIMIGAARGFLTAGIAYGILGILVGLHMAVGHDHGQRPTHAHILVIGWVSFFLFGLFYLHFGDAVRRWLTILHFWLAQLAMLGLTVGLWLLYSGKPQYEAIAAVSSIAYGVSFLVFAAAALPVLWRRND